MTSQVTAAVPAVRTLQIARAMSFEAQTLPAETRKVSPNAAVDARNASMLRRLLLVAPTPTLLGDMASVSNDSSIALDDQCTVSGRNVTSSPVEEDVPVRHSLKRPTPLSVTPDPSAPTLKATLGNIAVLKSSKYARSSTDQTNSIHHSASRSTHKIKSGSATSNAEHRTTARPTIEEMPSTITQSRIAEGVSSIQPHCAQPRIIGAAPQPDPTYQVVTRPSIGGMPSNTLITQPGSSRGITFEMVSSVPNKPVLDDSLIQSASIIVHCTDKTMMFDQESWFVFTKLTKIHVIETKYQYVKDVVDMLRGGSPIRQPIYEHYVAYSTMIRDADLSGFFSITKMGEIRLISTLQHMLEYSPANDAARMWKECALSWLACVLNARITHFSATRVGNLLCSLDIDTVLRVYGANRNNPELLTTLLILHVRKRLSPSEVYAYSHFINLAMLHPSHMPLWHKFCKIVGWQCEYTDYIHELIACKSNNIKYLSPVLVDDSMICLANGISAQIDVTTNHGRSIIEYYFDDTPSRSTIHYTIAD